MKKRRNSLLGKTKIAALILVGVLLIQGGCKKQVNIQEYISVSCIFNSEHSKDAGKCENIIDGNPYTYWGIEDSDDVGYYEILIELIDPSKPRQPTSRPNAVTRTVPASLLGLSWFKTDLDFEAMTEAPTNLDLKRIEATTFVGGSKFLKSNSTLDIRVFVDGKFQSVLLKENWTGERKAIARGDFEEVSKLSITHSINPEQKDGKAYIYELIVSDQCECSAAEGECCDGCQYKDTNIKCGDTEPANTCREQAYCTGESADCPTPQIKSKGTVCRLNVSSCDIAETCDGEDPTCPPVDKFKDKGEACGMCRECDGAAACEIKEGKKDCNGACTECDPFGACLPSGFYTYRNGEIIDKSDTACCTEGASCVYNGRCNLTKSYVQTDGNLRQCLLGNWSESKIEKKDWENKTGYCPVDDCYYSSECFKEGEFLLSGGDHYCEKGAWTTRTKLLATQLLNIVSADDTYIDDYTLFCDSYKDTLNYYNYLVKGKELTKYIEGKANNFCVLELGKDKSLKAEEGQVIVGISLKDDVNKEFIQTLEGVGKCPSYGDGKFHQCDTPKAWYENLTKSVIYSDKSLIGIEGFEANAWESFLTFLREPFTFIMRVVQRILANQETLELEVSDFSKLYIDKKGDKLIQGVAEKKYNGEFFTVKYSLFEEDICSSIEKSFAQFSQGEQIVQCYREELEGAYYAVSTSPNAMGLWTELTSKLRTPPPVRYAVPYCQFKQSCSADENTVLLASGVYDAHAAMEGGFEYKVCCEEFKKAETGERLITLSEPSDAHTSEEGFDYQVFIEGLKGDAECNVISTKCSQGETCILSMSERHDGHVSQCDNQGFGIKVCCKEAGG